MAGDMDLVRRAARGNGDAWREIQRIYEPWLFGFVLRRIRSHADAEDIVQDVLIGLLRTVGTYDGTIPLRAWLRMIASRAICSHLRRRYRDRVTDDEEQMEQAVYTASLRAQNRPDREAEAHEMHDLMVDSINRQLRAMPVPKRRVVAAALRGESNVGLSRRHDVNVNTVGCWKHETIQAALQEAGVLGGP